MAGGTVAAQTEVTSGVAWARRGSATRIAIRPFSLIIPVILFACVSAFLVATDPDYWWHLSAGRLMLETGSFPRVDPFSHTVAGQPWVAHEWLSEVLYAAVDRVGGYAANAALFGLVGALIVALVYATCRARGLGDVGAALLALWSFAIAFPVANWRPQLLTTALLALYAHLLTRYQQGSTRTLRALPPLMVLWVNLHGGYVIGLVLLGLTLAGGVWTWLRRQGGPPLRPLIIATALTAAATLASPLGLEALRYPFLYAGSGNFAMRFIADFQSPDFHQASYLPLALSFLLALAVGLGRRPLRPADLAWGLVFTYMALTSVRHIQLYAVIVLPLLGARLAAEDWAIRTGRHLGRGRARLILITLLWLPAALLGGLVVGGAQSGTAVQLRGEPNAAGYPAGAADYIRAHHLRGNLFNEFHWGGYLIYRLYPEQRVFIDGRADVYGEAFLEQYQHILRAENDWRAIFARYDIALVVVGKESPLAGALATDPAWQEVYAGEVERLFTRRASGQAPPAASTGR